MSEVCFTHTHNVRTHTHTHIRLLHYTLSNSCNILTQKNVMRNKSFFVVLVVERGILSTSGIIRSVSSIYSQKFWHWMFREWWIGAYTGLIRLISTGDTSKDLLHFFVAVGSQYVPHLQDIPEILVNLTNSNICWWCVRYLCTVKVL